MHNNDSKIIDKSVRVRTSRSCSFIFLKFSAICLSCEIFKEKKILWTYPKQLSCLETPRSFFITDHDCISSNLVFPLETSYLDTPTLLQPSLGVSAENDCLSSTWKSTTGTCCCWDHLRYSWHSWLLSKDVLLRVTWSSIFVPQSTSSVSGAWPTLSCCWLLLRKEHYTYPAAVPSTRHFISFYSFKIYCYSHCLKLWSVLMTIVCALKNNIYNAVPGSHVLQMPVDQFGWLFHSNFLYFDN